MCEYCGVMGEDTDWYWHGDMQYCPKCWVKVTDLEVCDGCGDVCDETFGYGNKQVCIDCYVEGAK